MQHLGDITKISGYDVPAVDVVIGGSPCQDLSIAGKRGGLSGERSGLFMEQIRIIKEMRAADARTGRTGQHIRPRFMVWENVPGAFSSNKRQDFKAVLEETIRIAEPDAPDIPLPKKWPLADAYYGDGWSVAYRVLDAQFWGVPQRRRRIALVADFGGQSAPEILFVRKGVCGDSAESEEEREGTATGTGRCSEKTVWCLQGNGIDRSDSAGCAGKGWNRDVAYTLNTMDRHVVCAGFKQKYNGNDEIYFADAIALRMRGGCDGGGKGPLIQVEKSGTLGCHNDQSILVATVDCRNLYENPELSATLQAKENGGQSLNYINPVRTGGIVRRLTPLECERLQGYPDGWTDIGPWVDSKGKTHKESSDSARYKALGNSIALPPWTWVLKRLCACYERPATMASLFDGIGGFPLIWERLNGPGSCLWVSEIEEFPMAVTKVRFGT